MKYVLSLVCASMLLALTVSVFADAKASKPKVGQAPPAFTLMDQNGKSVSLADYKDKVVVIEWFNDGCPFVVKHYQEGHMNKLAAKYAGQGVEWLLINTTNTANGSHNKSIADKWAITRPILDDSKGAVGQAYAATNTPEMLIVNKGVLVYTGAIDDRETKETSDIGSSKNYVAQALDEILAGKPVSEPVTKPYGCSVKYAK